MWGDRWTAVDWFIAGFATCAMLNWALNSQWVLLAGTILMGLLIGIAVVMYRASRIEHSDE